MVKVGGPQMPGFLLMSEQIRIERDVKEPDGTSKTEIIIVPIEPELADILFRQRTGQGLDFLVTPEQGLTIVKHDDRR